MPYHCCVIPSARLEGTSKDHLVICMKEGLCEIIWHLLQLHSENLWLWGLYHIPGEVSGNDCSHLTGEKKKVSYIELKHLLVWLVFSMYVSVEGEPPSSLNIGTFWWGACKPCLLQGKKICLLQSCLVEQILLVTLLCFFDSLSMSFLMSGDQTCTHNSRCCLIGMMTALSLVLMFLWLQLRFWLICWCCI